MVRFIQQLKEFGNQRSVMNPEAAMKWEPSYTQGAQLYPLFLCSFLVSLPDVYNSIGDDKLNKTHVIMINLM